MSKEVERYIDANPQLQGLIEPEIVLNLEARGIEWVPYWSSGEVLKIGKATFVHGRYTNDNHAKKHAMRYGCDLFYGHTHSTDAYSHELYGGTNTTYTAQSLGCLCKPMRWQQGVPDKWQQAFAVFEFLPDGEFGYSVIRIRNHRFVFNDRIYQ
jgi:hypothetical protein